MIDVEKRMSRLHLLQLFIAIIYSLQAQRCILHLLIYIFYILFTFIQCL